MLTAPEQAQLSRLMKKAGARLLKQQNLVPVALSRAEVNRLTAILTLHGVVVVAKRMNGHPRLRDVRLYTTDAYLRIRQKKGVRHVKR